MPAILIIDAEEALRKKFTDFLKNCDYAVLEAINGREGLEIFDQYKPDAVLVAVHVPEIDGYDMFSAILERSPETPVMFYSRYGDRDDITKALQMGVWDYFINPLESLMIVRHSIRKALERSRLMAENKKNRKYIDECDTIKTQDLLKTSTALREIEEELRLYEKIVDGSKDLMAFIDGNYIYRAVNNTYLLMHGKTRKEIIGFSVPELMGAEIFQKIIKDKLDRCLAGEETCYESWFDFPIAGHKYMEVSYYPFLMTDGKVSGVIVTSRDMTERKKAEEQNIVMGKHIQQVQKMKAIAALAGGIAHEFNNSLNSLLGNAELLEMLMTEDAETRKYTKRMKISIDKMANLTTQLLAYARGGKYNPQSLTLNDLVNKTLQLVGTKISDAVTVETSLPTDIFKVEADQTQMQIVLSAMLINASDAIAGQGRIKISLENISITNDYQMNPAELPLGSYVCMTVDDNGKGMDEETLSRVFEPFFTTNFPGRGLGMAAVYGIVTNHNGRITVNSKLGKGTIFKIYLPAVDVSSNEKIVSEKPTATDLKPSGTILLVEDDEALVYVTRQMIENLGYTVLTAVTGNQAVDMVKNYKETIDLVLLDFTLPDISAEEVFPRLTTENHDLKVIICSGLPAHGPVKNLLDAGATGYLQKPFTFKELSEMLLDVIERRREERFEVQEGEAVISEENRLIQGRIIDLSKGGLSLHVDGGDKQVNKFATLAIEVARDKYNLDKIPCEIISIQKSPDVGSFYDEKMKRVGIRFGELSRTQKVRLEYLINHYAIKNPN